MSRALRTRGAWEAGFDSTDGRVELGMKLVEFTNNHWAVTRMRVDSVGRTTELIPPGFPDGARVEVEEDGSGEVAADAVEGRILVIVRLTPRQGSTVD